MEQNKETDEVSQMRESVQKLGSSTEKYGEATLKRFLVARSMDPKKASKMFIEWQKWRDSFVPLGFIPDCEVGDELEARKIYLQGLSKQGFPVLLVKAYKHFPAKDQLQFKSILSRAVRKAFHTKYAMVLYKCLEKKATIDKIVRRRSLLEKLVKRLYRKSMVGKQNL